MIYEQYASEIYYITKKAGEIIMGFYSGNVEVMVKSDQSPVTYADLAANKYIVQQLKEITPDIPVVSEENDPKENKEADSILLIKKYD